jgi:hypothetical protein
LAAVLVALVLPAASANAAPRGAFHGGGFRGGRTTVVIGGGFWGWGWGWGYPYYGYAGYYPGAYGYRDGQWCAVKTDISPEEARVYLDGKYIGTADDFDGWPDKLYLRPGHYRLEFRLSGYEPRSVPIDARAGATLKLDDHLRRGGSAATAQPDPPKMEGNVQRYFGKRRDRDVAAPYTQDRDAESYANREGSDGPAYDSHDRDWDGDTQDRDADRQPPRNDAARQPARSDDGWRSGDRRPADATVSARADSRRDRSRLKISVEPSDAVVYVDDRFVGSADEVSSMDRGIVVAPGKHTVTVSRPGFRDKSRDVTVEAGKTETLEISLAR